MKLYYSSSSPFVRKVNVVAAELGLDKNIEWIPTNPWQAEDVLTTSNPLSKIPTLITDNGQFIYDSSVICEYLDDANKLIPKGIARWQVLNLQSLADGILEAGITCFWENNRDAELQSKDWVELHMKSILRTLDFLESSLSEWSDMELNLGLISLACALAWLDFRLPNENWRAEHAGLEAWFEQFSTRPSMLATVPKMPS